ncbi:MAG: hypothetical protein R3B09_06240 [Nannocystaceae bacterium]
MIAREEPARTPPRTRAGLAIGAATALLGVLILVVVTGVGLGDYEVRRYSNHNGWFPPNLGFYFLGVPSYLMCLGLGGVYVSTGLRAARGRARPFLLWRIGALSLFAASIVTGWTLLNDASGPLDPETRVAAVGAVLLLGAHGLTALALGRHPGPLGRRGRVALLVGGAAVLVGASIVVAGAWR